MNKPSMNEMMMSHLATWAQVRARAELSPLPSHSPPPSSERHACSCNLTVTTHLPGSTLGDRQCLVYGALLRCAAMHAQAPKNKGPALQNHESSIAFQCVDFLCPCPTSRITLMTPATSAFRRSCSSNWTQLSPCATRTALTRATP